MYVYIFLLILQIYYLSTFCSTMILVKKPADNVLDALLCRMDHFLWQISRFLFIFDFSQLDYNMSLWTSL